MSVEDEAKARALFRDDVKMSISRKVQLDCCLSAVQLSCVLTDRWLQPVLSVSSQELKLKLKKLQTHIELRYYCGSVEMIDHFTNGASCRELLKTTQSTPVEARQFVESVGDYASQLESEGAIEPARALRAAQVSDEMIQLWYYSVFMVHTTVC